MKTNSRILLVLAVVTGISNVAMAQQTPIQYFRTYDQKAVHMFETPKTDTVEFTGVAVRLGGNFSQTAQEIRHTDNAAVVNNTATPPVNINQLKDITPGFNLATANLNIDV